MNAVTDALVAVDHWLFFAINKGWSTSALDALFTTITNSRFWIPIYVLGLGYAVVRKGREGRWCAALVVLTVVVLDKASHYLLKETIHRLRPYEAMNDVIQLVGSGGGSFPSNHALNNAAAAVILSAFYPRLRLLWWGLASLVALSRIYCGVHYPSDVLGGMVIGSAAGLGVVALYRRYT